MEDGGFVLAITWPQVVVKVGKSYTKAYQPYLLMAGFSK